MFQVVIENGKYPEYVTEKFYDCIKLGTVPIYWGGEQALRKMGFDQEGIIFFDSVEELGEILNKDISAEKYAALASQIKNNWERLKEIRMVENLNLALHSVKIGYHQSAESYLGLNKQKLNLGFQ